MPTYQITSLVDITRTNPHRSETSTVKLSQQANFNSLIQAIGLRSNVEWEQDPTRLEGALPYPFDGRGAYWTWEFTVEREDVFLNNDDPVSLLIKDLHNVPVLSGLDETVELHPSAFQTQGSRINIQAVKL
jgi:hypothetical protein